ncbi:MAG: hypothetical protein AAFQ52_13140, partial [Chloroflexota bacterium]
MYGIIDTFGITLERIRQHSLLVFWVEVGMTIAITLALSLPLYVDAVYSGILDSRLDTPPYAYRLRYLGAWEGNVGLDDRTAINAAINDQFVEEIGLPIAQFTRFTSGGTWSVQATESNLRLGTFGVSAAVGLNDLMEITAGEWIPEQAGDDGRVPLLIPEAMLFENGIQVGDELIIQPPGSEAIDAYVAAMWRPLNENDPRWLFPPRFFAEEMLIPEATLLDLIAALDNETPIDELAWYLIFDGSGVRTADIDSLLTRSDTGQRAIERALPGIRLSDAQVHR